MKRSTILSSCQIDGFTFQFDARFSSNPPFHLFVGPLLHSIVHLTASMQLIRHLPDTKMGFVKPIERDYGRTQLSSSRPLSLDLGIFLLTR